MFDRDMRSAPLLRKQLAPKRMNVLETVNRNAELIRMVSCV